MFVLGKVVWAVVQPGNLLLLCLVAGTLLMFFGTGRRGRGLIAFATLGFLVLAVTPVGSAVLLPLEERFPRPHALPKEITGIIVLGGAVNPRLSQAFGEPVFNGRIARVLAGIALARQHPEAKLALLGGEGAIFPVGYPEARAMQSFALAEGIEPYRILVEERSRSTHENAVLGKAAIAPKPGDTWVLVTSASHMPRAVAVFRAVDWPVIPYPVDYRVDPESLLSARFSLLGGLATSTLAGNEWIGLLAYRLFGWTEELLPAPAPTS